MTKLNVMKYFCEDCGYLFAKEVKDAFNPDDVKCPRCNSEYVNHDLDRSLFKKIGMPELDRCDPNNCRACMFHCELFPDSYDENDE